MGTFRRAHPQIELTLLEDQTDALLAALAAGELHAALIGLGRHDRPPPDLEVLPVVREPLVVELAAEQLGVAVLPASGLEGAAGLVRLRLTHPTLDRTKGDEKGPEGRVGMDDG